MSSYSWLLAKEKSEVCDWLSFTDYLPVSKITVKVTVSKLSGEVEHGQKKNLLNFSVVAFFRALSRWKACSPGLLGCR